MNVTRHNPVGLPRNQAYAQGVSVTGAARTIYVGGQNAVTADGPVPGEGLGAQTERALRNIELVLADAGARLEDIVSWSILVVEGQPLEPGLEAFQRVWGTRGEPPAITMAYVSALASPAFLVEISAIAVTAA